MVVVVFTGSWDLIDPEPCCRIGATKSWNGQYTVDCATVPSLPDFTLYFDGKPYTLKGEEYILNGESLRRSTVSLGSYIAIQPAVPASRRSPAWISLLRPARFGLSVTPSSGSTLRSMTLAEVS